MYDKHPWETQWTETINYLNLKFPNDRLGDHVAGVAAIGRATITEDISLGRLGAGTEDKRHALRGLLLCQRVYFSTLWARFAWNGAPKVDEWSLDLDWKEKSLGHWANKNEREILAGLAMFVPVQGLTPADLVKAAKAGPPTGEGKLNGNLFLSRPMKDIPGPGETCYRGVCAWLLKAGFVSMRWIMSDSSPNGEDSCTRLFGNGEVVWSPMRPFYPTNATPKIEAGYIVHMWKDETIGDAGWNGHWVVSNGDGTVCGVNNGEVEKKGEKVIKAYTKNGTLRSQWEAYAGILTKPDPSRPHLANARVPMYPERPEVQQYSHAHMVKFNPNNIPRL